MPFWLSIVTEGHIIIVGFFFSIVPLPSLYYLFQFNLEFLLLVTKTILIETPDWTWNQVTLSNPCIPEDRVDMMGQANV